MNPWVRRMLMAVLSALILHSGASVLASPGLRIASEQIVVFPAPMVRVCDVIEDVSIVNPAATDSDVQLPLPTGAQSVRVGNGHLKWRTNITEGHATLTLFDAAKAHTSSQLSVSFQLPFTSAAGLSWTLSSNYATDDVKLYLPIAGFSLSAPGLQAATQTVTISGTRFRVFTRLAVPAGDNWPISVEGLPAVTPASPIHGLPVLGQDPSGRANEIQAMGNVAIIAFVLVLCMAGVRTGSRSRRRQQHPSVMETGVNALYDAWSNIERHREAGLMDETQYQERRAKFRDKIAQLQSSNGGVETVQEDHP